MDEKRTALRVVYASGCLLTAIVLLAAGATRWSVSLLLATAIFWSVVAWRERSHPPRRRAPRRA